MIELNRILGADYFIFYNISSDRNIKRILHHYKAQGLGEIIQWDLPRKVTFLDWFLNFFNKEKIHYHGQIAAINDCMYRNKGVSRFVVNQDLDEFIIPREHESWSELISHLPSDSSSFVFRSTIFRKDWSETRNTISFGEDSKDALKFGSITILKQFREKRIFPFDQRSKYIVRPECIISSDIHYITEHKAEKSCGNYKVPESLALVHHYRNVLSYLAPSLLIKDDRINIFKSRLLKRLHNKWDLLMN
ncbi:hypothetical protein FSP39_013019 [Pinctada imbricata]|uniref:Glycosyltransferase family 92 protein n=1 Tax=Pinctada imbricata TaxID=66713 RepID=A0AA88XZX9_PINIB|nr:hypothetical protein FSP39_013019 [Pinctada imbricata]